MSAETLPKVLLLYPNQNGTLFDRTACEQKAKLDTALTKAAAARIPEFQKQWDEEGPAYLESIYFEVGLPFPYREVQATLTVCFGSISLPLIINVRPYLPDPQRARPAWMFSFTVFHELMHTYQRPVFATSVLRKKYSSESETVMSHLHVMALEKLVLTKLSQPERLSQLHEFYNNHANHAYRRAWQIVNDLEDYKHFIEELKLVRKL